MTEQREYDAHRDGWREFRSGTASAGHEQIVDEQDHAFEHGRVSQRDEVGQD